uniref:tuftelin-interacting protein 11 n=1 Tax=Myxine glutinosa TaxID=7769 RepID=UPI00358ECF24
MAGTSRYHGFGKDDEELVERFEITDWDLENEFNPDRVRRKPTKEDVIYGIWAENDSDDERPRFSGSRKLGDLTLPVNFVSAGLRKSVLPEDEGSDGEQPAESESIPACKRIDYPREFGAKKAPKSDVAIRGGGNKTFTSVTSERSFGEWEKHTKGIGQKLLQKMGYVAGKGLGRKSQGIINPVEAQMRKGRGAIGAHGPERTEQSLRDFPVIDSEEEEDQECKRQLSQWKRDPGAAKAKPKYIYRTVEELKSRGIGKKVMAPSELSQVKVIDLTGKEQKVYYSYNQMQQRHGVPSEEEPPSSQDTRRAAFSMPELEHNLHILVQMAEQEIVQTDRQLRHEKDRLVSLGHELDRLQKLMHSDDSAVERLSRVLGLVDSCERRARAGVEELPPGEGEPPLTISEAVRDFRRLQEEFPEEYMALGLAGLAGPVVTPLIKQHFSGWDPLKDASFGQDILQEWKSILEDACCTLQPLQCDPMMMDPYHRLLWEAWMPCVRRAASRWQPRDCEPYVCLLEQWLPLLPPWLTDNILDQLVLPRLRIEVENWNPLTDTVPIHAWIHPWLPLMGPTRLEPLYAPIRQKLGNALQRWHPSDPSAKLILRPWKEVFSAGSWEAFTVKHILPKLDLCLADFLINPHQQHLDPFRWVMDWEGMLSISSLVSLLDKRFFPKWLQVLCAWLTNGPNYEEIVKWYQGWKSLFSELLLAHPTMRDKFNEALDIMNRAVAAPQGGFVQPGAREHVAYLTQTERRKDFQHNSSHERREAEAVAYARLGTTFPGSPAVAPSPSVPLSFKELLEAKAEEKNIVFMPLLGRRHDGKQLYTFGRLIMFIDRGVVFVQGEKTWVPTSLQTLLDTAL